MLIYAFYWDECFVTHPSNLFSLKTFIINLMGFTYLDD